MGGIRLYKTIICADYAADLADETGLQYSQKGETRCKQVESYEAGICQRFQGV